jgi:rsbT co-antagonist protein RsbR
MAIATARSNMCSGLGADELLELYRLDRQDLDRIRVYGQHVAGRMDDFIHAFYAWMQAQPEYARFFSDTDTLHHVQSLQRDHWTSFFSGHVDADYLGARRRVGEAHARIGLSLQSYLASMSVCQAIWLEDLYDGSMSDTEYGRTAGAIGKLIDLDISLVVEAFSLMVSRTISEQSRALMEMSTPVTALWDGILMLPVVGIIDSRRAQDIMGAMLAKIAETRSAVIILDISGVAVVDTAVANHLIKITKATRLMGCECVISGVSPAIAQTIVELGIEVGKVRTTATLQDALVSGFRRTGLTIIGTSAKT